MAHSVEIPYLNKNNIENYLFELEKEIEKANIGRHSYENNVFTRSVAM